MPSTINRYQIGVLVLRGLLHRRRLSDRRVACRADLLSYLSASARRFAIYLATCSMLAPFNLAC